MPDETFDTKKVIKLGGTTLELIYLGINHSDSNIVMRLPKEKIIFLVDTIPVGTFLGRGFIDVYPLETETFIRKVIAMDWQRMIPGHPGAPDGRLGTKKDAQDVLTLMQEASAEMKKLGQDGKCWEPAEKDFKLPKYANMPGYEAGIPLVARRYCGLWGRGT
jgi:glyoxylase-like metal-dependent hydrolase (beta-lactamase superfamily II)